LHQLVVDVDNSARVLDRDYIVVCWLLILSLAGLVGGGEVVLVRGLVGHLLDIGKWVEW
jgi:hypothetical protein